MRKKGLRTAGLLTALLMAAAPLLRPGLSFAGSGARLSDDAYISSDNSAVNFGTKPLLVIQDPTSISFIKFDLSTLPSGITGADVKKATLKVFVNKVLSTGSFQVWRVADLWTEAGITHNNAPPLEALQ